jgi:hypothetical protein
MDEVAKKTRGKEDISLDELVKLVRWTYQLSYTLAISLDRLDPCLEVLIAAFKKSQVANPVARVEKVYPGDPVHPATMEQVGYGLRVVYPLGLILYDAAGGVVRRACVLCS